MSPIETERYILEVKNMRCLLATLLYSLDQKPERITEPTTRDFTRFLHHTYDSIVEARFWLGKLLALLGEPYPYPKGNDLTTSLLDAPTDTYQAEILTGELGIEMLKMLRAYLQKYDDCIEQEWSPLRAYVDRAGIQPLKEARQAMSVARGWAGFTMGAIVAITHPPHGK